MTRYPTEEDWIECKRRAIWTMGMTQVITKPSLQWKEKMLKARHSPIRCLQFSFDLIEVPYWVTVHLVRHVHAQPYVSSQRNDRQDKYDRNGAPQNAPVNMIWDMNAEELMVIANKRLCRKTAPETREVIRKICDTVIEYCPEFGTVLVPMCMYAGCHEIERCGDGDGI